MDLRRRLARLDPLARKPAAADGSTAPVAPRVNDAPFGSPADAADATADENATRLAAALGLVPDPAVAEAVWSRQDSRNDVPRPAWPPADLAQILPAAAPAPTGWQDVLCLDTETTGLAGGTGTLAFLVGLGWWEDARFTIRQVLLPGPQREGPLLQLLAGLTGRFRVVATYNGGAFDLPLLRTRALLNRAQDPCGHLASWDLLTATRRLWGRVLPDCRQQTVEARICARARGPGDIDGVLIPSVYQAFLREREISLLPAVLRHNRRDIAGLGLLLGAIATAAGEIASGPDRWQGPAGEAWARALICERRGHRELAAAWARASVLVGGRLPDGSLPLAGVLAAIRQLKRVADWPLVAALVARGLARWPTQPRLHYEAAVLYEHRLGDPQRALVHARALADRRREQRLLARLARSNVIEARVPGGCEDDEEQS
jgi:uncharacterized protein